MSFITTRHFFSSISSRDCLSGIRDRIAKEIDSKTDNEILNVSADTYAAYLETANQQEIPILGEDTDITISNYEASIQGTQFPPEFAILDRNKYFKKPVIVFHLPFSGDSNFFNICPDTTYIASSGSANLIANEIVFEYVDFHGDVKQIRRRYDEDSSGFRQVYNQLKAEFEAFNHGLLSFALSEINQKKERVLQRNKYLASFNIPIKTNDRAPKTFSIPAPKLREKIAIKKPQFTNQPYVTEPTLEYSQYLRILKYISDVGKNFERYPSTYEDKREEALRDHIIMILDPNFEYGSATGETFNKKGKTDILIRYDRSVVFIAECKFWSGKQAFWDTINQLLGYLTWRDSKTAIVIFVRNKEIISALDSIKENISSHENFIRANSPKAEHWFENIFSLPGDPNKEVLLSILVFHLPPKTT